MNAILPRPAYEDSLMQITFSDDKPTFDGANLMVRFMARVDGEPVVCAITVEALEDHFGAGSPLESELMEPSTRAATASVRYAPRRSTRTTARA